MVLKYRKYCNSINAIGDVGRFTLEAAGNTWESMYARYSDAGIPVSTLLEFQQSPANPCRALIPGIPGIQLPRSR